MRTHGHAEGGVVSPTYGTWRHMLERCRCKTSDHYKWYGARGIKVCARWLKFENFLADMGERPAGKSLDRYPNNDGDYKPSNCRWATQEEQSQNSSFSKLFADEVLEIRKLRGLGVAARKVGRMFGVAHTTVLKIEKRQIWRNV